VGLTLGLELDRSLELVLLCLGLALPRRLLLFCRLSLRRPRDL
jgi:hypothetical protein